MRCRCDPSRTQDQPEVQSNVGEQQEVPCFTDSAKHHFGVSIAMMMLVTTVDGQNPALP